MSRYLRLSLFTVGALFFCTQLHGSSRFGVNDSATVFHGYLNPAVYEKASILGTDWVRIWFWWDRIEPSDNQFQWAAVDQAVSAALSQGMEIYATIVFAPAWATGGSSHYEAWYCMLPNGQYNPAPPGCVNGVPPNEQAFRAFVAAAVARYPQIAAWSFWNEPDSEVFWHSPGAPLSVIDRILIPGYQAAKAVNPSVVVAGPDAVSWLALGPQGPDYFIVPLVNRNTSEHFIDVYSFHAYGVGGDVDNLIWHIDNFLPYVSTGLPVWVTEAGIKSGTTPQGWKAQADKLAAVVEAVYDRPAISKLFIYRLWGAFASEDNLNLLYPEDAPRPAYFKVLYSIAAHEGEPGDFEGNFDECSCAKLRGWAWDSVRPDMPLAVDIYVDGELFDTIYASLFRQDLQNAGKGLTTGCNLDRIAGRDLTPGQGR
jgi:hypothetical protein